ncbi:branched-chain amino acid aminotransferase [Haladaptatus litoreus]|uniref:Branched-chain amino acid aminotransferase n=1 Tax=Haladaptatus litoreus TaxID=553468 RepID=A0A1N6WKG9_9EURY|nr:aminotransferase class IV [Haladaptatus litoreus]SIQ90613.1 branched-chain amino acid aminotransferase [Haladaptatus litoreus]
MQYHVNGNLVPAEEATVSVRDRGFMYGDAGFETLRAYGGTMFEWEAHANRLRRTCDVLSIDHGIGDGELRKRIHETLEANDLRDAYVKCSITRGVQAGKLTPGPADNPTVVVIVSELPRGGKRGTSVWDAPATAEIVKTRRVPDHALPAHAKTHNYLNGTLARLETEADEALMLDLDGNLTEGATSNLFFVRKGVLHTPSLSGAILPGITRTVVLELADELGIPTRTGCYRPVDLRRADEAFLTNTTWEVRPVGSLGDTELEIGSVTRELATAFDALVESRHY